MNHCRLLRRSLPALFPLALLALAAPDTGAAPAAPAKEPPVKRVEIEKNVSLEIQGKQRRVIVKAVVCLRDGPLEGLLTRTLAKEHEYVLASDCDARKIHSALEIAVGKAGAPVTFLPKYKPAHGPGVRVSLRYQKDGKTVTVSAKEWVREAKSKKALDQDWVFAGSRFVPHPDGNGKPPIYVANHGDLICLCNMDTAMLDLPVPSPKRFDSRLYEANTERIPPKDTPVEVILEPVAAPAKKGKG
jgi:hypothetical protein